MRAVDLILKKRCGNELTPEEITSLVHGFTADEIPDYQMSAFLMAVTIRGMTNAETAALTEAMTRSGVTLDLSKIPGRKVDKHSTGGVGDKTSLVVAPAVAAAGLTVPMISGRALAHTGGTLDKLESIPGFRADLPLTKFMNQVRTVRAAMIGQTAELAPADRKIYALRDVTATVDSIPLIASSIMSKKLAEGIDALVLDVKTGSGAFMKRQEDAETLAQEMVGIGRACGKRVVALITDMNQPLGEMAGNALEVTEALAVLAGGGPEDVVRLCRELSAHCLVLGEAAESLQQGRELFDRAIQSGKALDKFREIIRWQGGDPEVADDPSRLPTAKDQATLQSRESGWISAMDTQAVGMALSILGAGRETVESIIDDAVGLCVHKKIGDFVETGTPLCTVHYNDSERLEAAKPLLLAAYRFSPSKASRPDLIKNVVS